MTRWENTSVYRALGTLSALPVRALSRLPLKAGKRRCGLSFSQWFLLLGMGAMLCVPHGAWNNLYAVLFALAALLVYWFGCAARKDTPRNVGDLGPAALGFLLMTVLCTLWAGNKAGNLRVALFFWTGFLLAYLTAAQFRTRTDQRTAAAALYITLLAVSLYGLWNYVTGAEASDVPIDGEMYRRLGATLEHGINCGEFLAMALPIALVWALTAPTKARRIALTVPLLLPCVASLLTYARTGWIMLALALVLPFLTGQIPEIGSMLCPMHLPALLCGFMCGWPWGLAVGLISPLLRSVIFGMPPMFPTAVSMAFEMAAYGAVSGLLYRLLPKKKGYI